MHIDNLNYLLNNKKYTDLEEKEMLVLYMIDNYDLDGMSTFEIVTKFDEHYNEAVIIKS